MLERPTTPTTDAAIIALTPRSTRYATWCTCIVCEQMLPKKNAASISQNGAPRTASPSVAVDDGEFRAAATANCGACLGVGLRRRMKSDEGTIHSTQIAASTRNAVRQP